MKLLYIISSLMMMAGLTAAAQEPTPYDLKVNDFTELKVVDDVNVVYRCVPDSAGHVHFTARPDEASAFIFQPDGVKLQVELSPEVKQRGDALPTITVYSTFLNRAENYGKGHLRVATVAAGPKITLVLEGNGRITARNLAHTTVEASTRTGNGEIVVGGRADTGKYFSLGSGNIQADELKVREAKCRIAGTGSIGVNATDALTVSGLGSGSVYYLGTPQIKNRTLGIKTSPLAGK